MSDNNYSSRDLYYKKYLESALNTPLEPKPNDLAVFENPDGSERVELIVEVNKENGTITTIGSKNT